MTVVDDFLQRLGQHLQAQQDRLSDKGQNPLEQVANILTTPIRAGVGGTLDTIGLGLEGTEKLGNYAAGEISLPLAAVQAAVGDPRHPATIAAKQALAAGAMHPQAALDALRNSGDTPTSWLAGALAMSDNPANLIPLPAGEAANALKGAAQAARRSASFSASDAGKALLAGLAEKAVLTVDSAVDPVGQAIQAALTKLQAKPDLEGIFNRLDRAQALPDMQAGVRDAEDQLQQMTGVYKDVQAQKATAVRDLKVPYQGAGGRVGKWSPEQLQAMAGDPEVGRLQQMIDMVKSSPVGGVKDNGLAGVGSDRQKQLKGLGFQLSAARKQALTAAGLPTDGQAAATLDPLINEAKNAVELLNPQGPQNRQPFADFLKPYRATVNQAAAQRDDAVGQIRAALTDAGDSPITADEASLLSQPVATGRDPLADVNAQFNVAPGGPEDVRPAAQQGLPTPAGTEIDPQTGQAVLTSPDGMFQAKFDPGSVPQNPVAQEAALVANPVKALDQSNPLQEKGYAGKMWDMLRTATAQGWAKNKASFGQPWQKVGLQEVSHIWGATNIETPKNLIGDYLFSKWVLLNEGISQRLMTGNEELIAHRLATGETQSHLLAGRFGDYMERFGYDVNDPRVVKDMQAKLGSSAFATLEADSADHLNEMNGLQKALVGSGLQLASPTSALTGIATAPLNLLMTMKSHMFHIINNVTHTAARTAAFEDAFLPLIENSAKDMLQRASAEGLDVSALVNQGLVDATDKAGTQLATDGFFSPELVRQELGDRYAAEWAATRDYAFQQGFDRSKAVLGNYQLAGAAGTVEGYIRKFVPFMSWAWRAYPRTAKYALQHPAVTVGLLHLIAADRALAAQEGRPGYQVGTIPINKDTPVIGLLASVFTPEQEATVRLNPLSLFSPLGGDQLGLGMDDNKIDPSDPLYAQLYQHAKQDVGLVGGSFNPLIQAGAYISGADYAAPPNASRYAPIDQAVGQATGLQVPTIQGPLRAARSAFTGALADVGVGRKQVDTYDPVENRAKELVYERTGKPVMDPSNGKYAQEIKDKQGVYSQAQQDLLTGNARKTVVNAVSPVSVQVTTDTTANRQAAGQPPFSYDDLQAAKDQKLTGVYNMMTAANNEFYRQHPEAAVNKDAPAPAKTTASSVARLPGLH